MLLLVVLFCSTRAKQPLAKCVAMDVEILAPVLILSMEISGDRWSVRRRIEDDDAENVRENSKV